MQKQWLHYVQKHVNIYINDAYTETCSDDSVFVQGGEKSEPQLLDSYEVINTKYARKTTILLIWYWYIHEIHVMKQFHCYNFKILWYASRNQNELLSSTTVWKMSALKIITAIWKAVKSTLSRKTLSKHPFFFFKVINQNFITVSSHILLVSHLGVKYDVIGAYTYRISKQ